MRAESAVHLAPSVSRTGGQRPTGAREHALGPSAPSTQDHEWIQKRAGGSDATLYTGCSYSPVVHKRTPLAGTQRQPDAPQGAGGPDGPGPEKGTEKHVHIDTAGVTP